MINGHANSKSLQDEYDLVCCAVSAVCFSAISFFEDEEILLLEENKDKGYFKLKLNLKQNKLHILQFWFTQFKSLYSSYNKYITYYHYEQEIS